jgi:hypothetical protein
MERTQGSWRRAVARSQLDLCAAHARTVGVTSISMEPWMIGSFVEDGPSPKSREESMYPCGRHRGRAPRVRCERTYGTEEGHAGAGRTGMAVWPTNHVSVH